ncbi:uncharacterized protein [Primulina eburnea]|uniref:uncharacterized protein n=1 Tax=Primulina eburnea TaxID=1245227 RepID=UPI003C6C4D60
MSGHLVKWTTELGEYDIQYEPRTAIKAQALSDFLAENMHQENEDLGRCMWMVPRRIGSTTDEGMYDVKDEKLIEYAREVDRVKEKFTEITFEQIPRKENEKADTLAKMAGTMGSWKTRDVVFQFELTPQTSSPAVEQEEEDWRTGIVDYLKEGKFPDNPREARPLLKCLSYQEADYVLREVHEGCCGNHLGAYALARKVMLAGYSWPSLLHDAQELAMSCDSCQCHARLHHRTAAVMKAVTAACLFDQWRIDIVGSFPITPTQKKFLFVAVDYFSKLVETEPLARITEKYVLNVLVEEYSMQIWTYPQSNGQVEVTNRTLVQGLKVRFSKVLPAEIGLESIRVVFYDEDNDARRDTDLDLLDEKSETASIHMEAYKNRIAQSYNRRVIQRNFHVGEFVLRKVQEEQRGNLDQK